MQVPEVVKYERGTGWLLGPAPVDPATLLPGGAAATKRRQLAQASVGTWVDGTAVEGAAADTPQHKRQRVSLGKCHNCGSYGHALADCPLPRDHKRVIAAAAELRAERGLGAFVSMKQRYFESQARTPAGVLVDKSLKPGSVTPALAAASGEKRVWDTQDGMQKCRCLSLCCLVMLLAV